MSSEKPLKKALGLPSAVAMVMGSMIGSGIFIVPAEMARELGSSPLMIVAWLITGFLTIVGALSYGELAAMMPKAGGQYVFLRESLGPIWGFLYGWALFLVIQTGTIAAVAVAFGKFLGVLLPSVSASHWFFDFTISSMHMGLNSQNCVAIAVIAVLTFVNIFGVKSGAIVQNVFTLAKILALIGLVVVGFTWARSSDAIAANFSNFFSIETWVPQAGTPTAGTASQMVSTSTAVVGSLSFIGILIALGVSQVGSLFSSDAWNNVTFAAAEVKEPQRNLPLALALGTGSVILLYIFANFAYLNALPLSAIQSAPEDRVGTAVLSQVFANGSGAVVMAIAILISTFGCVNGMILAGARVYYAMSEDKLFFASAGKIHPRFQTPVAALVMQGVWASVLCLTGSYGQLLDYIMFAVILFYILTIIGLFILRRTKANLPRPYRAVGYPILPASYIVLATFIDGVLLIYKPQYTWPGLIIVCSGIPVYFIWKFLNSKPV